MSALGPCQCLWCQRYGKTDSATCRVRISVTEDGASFVKMSGRCTRCHHPLGDDAAFIVRESVVWKVLAGSGVALTQNEFVPVCTECVTDKEMSLHETYGPTGRCLNCQRGLKTAARGYKGRWPAGLFCDNACNRQYVRKQRRNKSLICTVCNISFTSARTDSRFCSNACRQWAYRRRAA